MARLKRSDMLEYQRRGTEFVIQHANGALWEDMGLGKTVQALTGYLDLRNSLDAHKMLVIAPLRIARSVWTEEIAAWEHLQGLTASRILGNPAQRLAAMKADTDIYLINRENVKWLEDQFLTDKGKLIQRWPWDMVVLDESQSFKSQSSKRFTALKHLRKLFARCIQLTGTPIPNGYADIWSQAYLLDGGSRLGRTEKAFRDRWFDPPPYATQGCGWTEKPYAAKQIQEAMSDIVLSLRAEDYLDLPPVKNNYIWVRMPHAAQVKYRKLARKFVFETFANNQVTAVNAGDLTNKLAQLANGIIFVQEGVYEEFHDEKVKALEEILDGIPKALIAYRYVPDLIRIEAVLRRVCAGTRRTWGLLDTQEDQDRWNRGGTNFLVLHPASAGHGLNLQFAGAQDIVWYGLTNNLEHYQQLNARLTGGHRRGDKTIKIHHIIANETIDELLIDLIERKATTQEALKAALASLL